MRVAKVHLTAAVASFRYPHFLVGRQPSYEMPPPSTIYGHIASAVGEWISPVGLRFAYTFTRAARSSDLEHEHIISADPPQKLSRQEAKNFREWRSQHSLSVGGSIQPTLRDFLFQVDLILYLQPFSLVPAFRSPVFPVVLGRSQDLACVESVEEVTLDETPGAYLDSTILPFSWRGRTRFGTTVLMPRFITPPPDREPSFEQYIVLPSDRTLYGGNSEVAADHPRRLLRYEESESWFVDPTSPVKAGVHRGLVFLSFADS